MNPEWECMSCGDVIDEDEICTEVASEMVCHGCNSDCDHAVDVDRKPLLFYLSDCSFCGRQTMAQITIDPMGPVICSNCEDMVNNENLPSNKKITLCGSTKFKKQYEAWNKILSLRGNLVYSVLLFDHSRDKLTDEQKELLEELHLRKIDNSDTIFIIDVGGYIGNSTRAKIDYAVQKGKVTYHLSQFIGIDEEE